ncbi:MAG: LacI family transcriptional regulator, partial [Lentisphaerae bacterium]
VDTLKQKRVFLDAVICPNDVLANELALALWGIGINPKQDVMVTGCDGTLLPKDYWTVEVDIPEIAARAVSLLLAELEGTANPRETHIETVLRPPYKN